MGRGKDKNPNSEARKRACRENASKPRVQLPEEVREALTKAKGRLGSALAKEGVDHIVAILKGGPGGEHGSLFEWAATFAADRAGMRRISELEVNGDAGKFTIVVEGKDALGWPDAGDTGGDAGAD